MSNVQDFGAAGDGKRDDTEAIQHAIEDGDGLLYLPPGTYLISRTIEIDLDKRGPAGIEGAAGTAKFVMNAPGPALRFTGTRGGTAHPPSVKPAIWQRQRMPTVRGLEIEGANKAADGIALTGTMQAILEAVAIRKVRNGVSLLGRNRNVIITHCQIYENTGMGVLIDEANLHQINIVGCHISYNRLGGIRIERSEVRNLQITGNDIEYNNHRVHNTPPEPTAEIYIDTTADGASVNEVTVASNTIQATPSRGGANLRIIEKPGRNRPPGLWSISGNIIGSQENNVRLTGCHGVVLSGNFIYSCEQRSLVIEQSSQVNVTGNSFRRHTETMGTGVRLVDSADCILSGCTVQDETPEGQSSGACLLEIANCRRLNITGCQFLDGVPYGIDVSQSSGINIQACTVVDTRQQPRSQAAIKFSGSGEGNLVMGSNLQAASGKKALQAADESGVRSVENLIS